MVAILEIGGIKVITKNEGEFDDIEWSKYEDIVESNRDKVGLLSQDELLYYANDLESLDDYLDCCVCGIIDNDEYENYDYPLTVLIREYEKCPPCISIDEDEETYYANVRALDDYLSEVDSVRMELENRMRK